jgi:uncharacterized protein (DUF934 family)
MKFIDPQHDAWQAIEDLRDATALHAGTYPLLSVGQWRDARTQWPNDMPAGVLVRNDEDIELLEGDLHRLALVVLQFPKWTDGRAYTQARLLRSRFRYEGEVRATGEVLVDMLPLLHRTGFDAVLLRHDQSLDSAQRALCFFAGHYQGDVHEPRPVFQRAAQTN